MLHKRLEERLSRNWPLVPSNAQRKKAVGWDPEIGIMAAAFGDGAPAARNRDGAACKRDPTVDPKVAIDATIEVTGVPAELAAYALRIAKVHRCPGGINRTGRACTAVRIYYSVVTVPRECKGYFRGLLSSAGPDCPHRSPLCPYGAAVTTRCPVTLELPNVALRRYLQRVG